MRKPKSKEKRVSENKRGYKRTLRLKASRKKVADRRAKIIEVKKEEQKKFNEFIKKLQEARAKGEF